MALIRWQQSSARGAPIVARHCSTELFSAVPVSDEEMISLWQRLLVALPQKPRITLGVVSTRPGEGASTVVRGLARVVVKNPTTKILICDVFRGETQNPTADSIPMRTSVVDLLFADGRMESSNTVQWFAGSRIAMGALGDAKWLNTISADPEAVTSIIGALSSHFDVVLLDLPPMNSSIATPVFARAVDGVLLVVEAERTPAQAVRAARDAASIYGGNVVGVVLNKRRHHGRGLVRRGLDLVKWPR